MIVETTSKPKLIYCEDIVEIINHSTTIKDKELRTTFPDFQGELTKSDIHKDYLKWEIKQLEVINKITDNIYRVKCYVKYHQKWYKYLNPYLIEDAEYIGIFVIII